VQIPLAFRFAFAILESLKRNTQTGENEMREYLVTFANGECVLVDAIGVDGAQEMAIDKMESQGRVHDEIVSFELIRSIHA
jgi:hypothetical protein